MAVRAPRVRRQVSGLVEFQRGISMRSRVTVLAAGVVAVAVALLAVAAYTVVARALDRGADADLEQLGNGLAASALPVPGQEGAVAALRTLKSYNPDVDAVIVGAVDAAGNRVILRTTPDLELKDDEWAVVEGRAETNNRREGGSQVYARSLGDGRTLVLVRSLQPTREILDRLAVVLTMVGGIGIVVAAVTGLVVGRAGLRPVARLTAAAERVARTGELRPIPAVGDDELARLTDAYNHMMAALSESRERQTRLVADAGHELKTPLTSMRTNIELVMAAARPGAPALAATDREELERDVIAQLDEMATLVGDLVDLAREDVVVPVATPVDLAEIVDAGLERVRRRRPDVHFDVATQPWAVQGDAAGLGRAVVNLLDNAAKWSPPEGTVEVRLEARGRGARLEVADRGPGIPEAERVLVFERFYRSAESRSMPGSGLGLAIVRQVVERHGGTVAVEGREGGGARLVVDLPGRPGGRRGVDS